MNTTSPQNSTLVQDCSGALKNAEIVILSAMNSVLALLSVVGNALILAAIYRVESQRTPSNAFVASMGVADFSVGLFMNPLWVAKSVLNIWKSDNQLSTAIEVLTMQTIVATTFSLCAVSVDRYIAVTKMRYNEIMNWKRIRSTITFIWIFSLLFACLRLFITDPLQLPKLWLAATVITVIAPLTIISICYYHIFKAAGFQMRKISASVGTRISADQAITQLKHRKAALTIGIVVGVFTICWTPSLVISLIQFFTTNNCQKLIINGYWFWGALAEFGNSAFNPFIYCIRSRDFRKAVKKAIGECVY
ncbi:octopamine receptor Oamb-like [Stylophora pistillata]|uniref:octopamine receptor Oamb-like n=1 Tax=Stylophora pistillata TaxID=50429 RepID=UPI000C048107|nr:octopamine receptor Oamb-like [Stylophora pistillata]